jgi:hypothetical protein
MVREDASILKAINVAGLIPYSKASFPKIPIVPHMTDATTIKRYP